MPVTLHTQGAARFVPSTLARDDQVVEVYALAVTMTRGDADDSHQWCVDVTLN